MRLRFLVRSLAPLALLALAACGGGTVPSPTKARLTITRYENLAGWQEDQAMGEALGAFQRSCRAWTNASPGKQLGKGDMTVSASTWQNLCAMALPIFPMDEAAARGFFLANFTPVAVEPIPDNHGLVTGYYEPLLFGSRTCGGRYTTPLYSLPPDRKEGVPYYDRKAINEGALAGRGLELVCVDDPVAAFFLEIQGSGRIALEDGGIMRVGFAGQNGYKYQGIGKLLIDRGVFEKGKVTLVKLKQWLRDHPTEAVEVMQQNPSYVFFQERTGFDPSEGPLGAQGVPLTPQRSLAVDPRFVPYGAPVFLDTTLPASVMHAPVNVPFRRLFIAQDTGGAIKGPARADLFFGFEPPAETLAGGMQQKGTFTLLLPPDLAARLNGRVIE